MMKLINSYIFMPLAEILGEEQSNNAQTEGVMSLPNRLKGLFTIEETEHDAENPFLIVYKGYIAPTIEAVLKVVLNVVQKKLFL